MGRLSIDDVATAAGVHRSTVSRAFSRPNAVKPETRDHVLAVAERLGYRMNTLAQALRTKASTLVPFLVPDITNPFFAELAHAASTAANAEGYQLVLGVGAGRPDPVAGLLELMDALYAPFAVVAPANEAELDVVLDRAVGNVVVVDRVTADVALPSVSVDNAQGVDLAMSHLLELGHRDIAYVAGPSGTLTAQERLAAYEDAAARNGIEPTVLDGDFDLEAGRRAAEQLLDGHLRATAVIASNDMAAFGFMAAVTEAGLTVPGDLSVVGFDGLTIGRTSTPALTTVAQPIELIARAAIELALLAVAGEPPRHRVLAPELVVRRSTRTPQRRRGGRG